MSPFLSILRRRRSHATFPLRLVLLCFFYGVRMLQRPPDDAKRASQPVPSSKQEQAKQRPGFSGEKQPPPHRAGILEEIPHAESGSEKEEKRQATGEGIGWLVGWAGLARAWEVIWGLSTEPLLAEVADVAEVSGQASPSPAEAGKKKTRLEREEEANRRQMRWRRDGELFYTKNLRGRHKERVSRFICGDWSHKLFHRMGGVFSHPSSA